MSSTGAVAWRTWAQVGGGSNSRRTAWRAFLDGCGDSYRMRMAKVFAGTHCRVNVKYIWRLGSGVESGHEH